MGGITRRQGLAILAGGAAAAALPSVVRARAAPPELVAAPGTARLGPPEVGATDVWAFGGTVPGPEIRLPQGARLQRRFVNGLPQPSSVHWHGIRITNGMDGVAGLTQPAVASGDTFDYDFALPDAGTYWYHPHNRTYEQMARGLYGALIVEEPEGTRPDVDADWPLLIDDWRLDAEGQIAGGFGALHDRAHGGRLGNWATVNGQSGLSRPVAAGARLRLRLINAANARIFALGLRGMTGWIVALDGMPLEAPQAVDGEIVLAPAQRADLIVDVTEGAGGEALLLSGEGDATYVLAAFPVTAGARALREIPPAPLPPNPMSSLRALDGVRVHRLTMEGGAMGGLRNAAYQGRDMPLREMAQEHGMVWAFNGTAGMSTAPWLTARRGQTLRIAMVNDTAWPHGMHLHGHHFRQVRGDGGLGPWRDTLLIERGETAEIAFVADNPGDWLLHCHMLEHAASGMMTWVRVS